MSGDNTTDQPDTPLENLSEEQNSEYLSAEDTQLKGLYESLNAVQGVVNKERKQNRTMGAELQELKNVVAKPNAWESNLSNYGDSPEKIIELLSSKDENAFQEMQTQIEKVKTAEREKYETEIKEVRQENEAFKKREVDTFINSTARSAIGKHKGNVEALLPHVAKNLSVQRVNGKLEAVVLDDYGQVDHTKDVNSVIRDLQNHESFQPLFASKAKKLNNDAQGLNRKPSFDNSSGRSIAEQLLANKKALT